MGLFGDLDIAAAADNPFAVDPGTYPATVSDVVVKESKDKTKTGLNFTYTITGEGPMVGRNVSEWKTLPTPANPKNPTAEEAQALSFLKMRLASLGIPEARMNSIVPEDLVGIDVVITVKQKDEYTNVTKVVLADESSNNAAMDNPFANMS